MSHVLVFSVALNGYQWRYRPLLDSHRRYCQRMGYHYVAVTRPAFSSLGLEVAWLKIKLILEALNAGYHTVLFLDADTHLADTAPDIETAFKADRHIFAARGFSGRFNSGVLLVRNRTASIRFFEHLLEIALDELPATDAVGWGENGHFIHLANGNTLCGELDPRWNNNHRRELSDYIRHFSRGPLYALYRPRLAHHLLERGSHYLLALYKRVHCNYQKLMNKAPRMSLDFYRRLNHLTHRVCQYYPVFQHRPALALAEKPGAIGAECKS